MSRILYINACVRPDSRTAALAQHVLKRLGCIIDSDGVAVTDGGASADSPQLEEVRLERELLQPLYRRRLQVREALLEKGDTLSPFFRYAQQFAAADTIVIAAPYWNLLFPASLNLYLENICAIGVTFRYDKNDQPQTLCKAKKLLYVSTAGGPLIGANSSPDASARHLGYEYVKTLAKNFFHIDDCTLFCAEGLDIAGADVDAILSKAYAQIDAALA